MKNIISIEEESQIPNTDILIEEGDTIQIVEAVKDAEQFLFTGKNQQYYIYADLNDQYIVVQNQAGDVIPPIEYRDEKLLIDFVKTLKDISALVSIGKVKKI